MASCRAALLAVVLLDGGVAEAAAPAHPLVEAVQVEPNRCFDAASLAPVVARWLQRDAIDRRLRVEIAGQPGSPDGLTLRVLRDGTLAGERVFPGLDAPCDEVRAAVGLAAAIAIDATILESLGVTPAPPVPAPEPEEAKPPPRSWPRFQAAADGIALFGVLPSAVAGFAPALGIRLVPPLELRLSAIATGAASLSLAGRAFDVTLDAGRLDACAALRFSIVRARTCAGVAAGRLLATSADQNSSVSQAVPWVAAIGRADARLAVLPWLGLVLGADAIVPVTRPRFEILGPTGAPAAASGLPVIGAAVSLGPEITFP
jgi:hypothetical protein